MKKILSLDLGITSVGYSVIKELENNRYELIDYGVNMFDKSTDAKGNSKKLLHSSVISSMKLKENKRKRKNELANIFDEFGLEDRATLLLQEKGNIYKNKWKLRAKTVFNQKLTINELFTILYHISAHRGYKSLESGDLLEELANELNIDLKLKKPTKNDEEKGKIKNSLKNIENLKLNSPDKTVATIIYDVEMSNDTPIFRNHGDYKYMIRREFIEEEIVQIINTQVDFGLFNDIKNFDKDKFISKLKTTIIEQKESSNDLSLFSKCPYYTDEIVAHQYSYLSDIYKMYESVANIRFNTPKDKISKEQIKLITNDIFAKISKGKNIKEIKYKDIRQILKLDDSIKIFGKEDSYMSKAKKVDNSITRFHFLTYISNLSADFIDKLSSYDLDTLKNIFDTIHKEKTPKTIYNSLKSYSLNDNDILELIKNKSGNSLNISSKAMVEFIPYFERGMSIDDIKVKLNLQRNEDYSKYKKGIKYLQISQYEEDDKLDINNHIVKSALGVVLRLIKHLHGLYGTFDEIKVESTRDLSLNDKAKKDIDKANKDTDKLRQSILDDIEYQNIAKSYNTNLKKYVSKILMWQSQDEFDIYSGAKIGISEIFDNSIDIDHIVPQSVGGLSVKHNLVLVHRDSNSAKSNRLPLDFIKDKQKFINLVEELFASHKINWKKRKNLLATNLDEIYKDTFESKELRATSYIEALCADILKRYYPFEDNSKQKDGSAIRHIQGRATSNLRKVLKVKNKSRDTNIHHAIDAILIGIMSRSWLQKLSNAFRQNYGLIEEDAIKNISQITPYIDGLEVKDLVKEIEQNYLSYGEDSIFYKDFWGHTKTINFWVSKKPLSSKIHNDTIYGKKSDNIYTSKKEIIKEFISLDIKPTSSLDDFDKKFKKNILDKLYLYKTNPKDKICQIITQRAEDIKRLLSSFDTLDLKDKEALKSAKDKLEILIHNPLIDYNDNIIRRVKFYQTNLTGFEIRGGLATKEKSFIGFEAKLENSKLQYQRIDVANFEKIKNANDNSFKAYRNDIVFFVFEDGNSKGGKIVSFLDDKGIVAFSNPRYPASITNQPHSFLTIFNGKPNSHKQHSINKAIGIIKLKVDILGNILPYQTIGKVQSEIYEFVKSTIKK